MVDGKMNGANYRKILEENLLKSGILGSQAFYSDTILEILIEGHIVLEK